MYHVNCKNINILFNYVESLLKIILIIPWKLDEDDLWTAQVEKNLNYDINWKKNLDGNIKKIPVEWHVFKNNTNVENFSLNVANTFSAQYFFLLFFKVCT